MQSTRVEIELLPAVDDPSIETAEYQRGIGEFSTVLRGAGIRYTTRAVTFDAADAQGYALGQFILEWVKTLTPLVAGAAVAWIHARGGRKVRIKVKDLEVEATSLGEVEALFKLVDQRSKAEEELRDGDV